MTSCSGGHAQIFRPLLSGRCGTGSGSAVARYRLARERPIARTLTALNHLVRPRSAGGVAAGGLALRAARCPAVPCPVGPPGGHVGYVGVANDVQLPGQELFFSRVHLHGGPAPVRRFLPELVDLIVRKQINPG